MNSLGIQELEGIAYRTDYDLSCHQKGSGRPLEYFDEETRKIRSPCGGAFCRL